MKVYVESGTLNFLGISEDDISVDYHRPQEVYQVIDPVLESETRQNVGRLKRCVIGGGEITEAISYIEQTGPMQLTVSNGNYGGRMLDLPLADRQVNITADPVYDTLIEISIIRNDATGAIDVAYCTNSAPIAAGWSIVQTILSGIIPAGTIDLNTLGLI